MTRPRFGLKTLLIIATVIALWLSTFTTYTGNEDVRNFIMLSVTIASGAAAICSNGATRAFWGGFFVTMLAMGSRGSFFSHSPRLQWISQASMSLARYLPGDPVQKKHHMMHVMETLHFLVWLAMAAAIGAFCAYIYRQSRISKK